MHALCPNGEIKQSATFPTIPQNPFRPRAANANHNNACARAQTHAHTQAHARTSVLCRMVGKPTPPPKKTTHLRKLRASLALYDRGTAKKILIVALSASSNDDRCLLRPKTTCAQMQRRCACCRRAVSGQKRAHICTVLNGRQANSPPNAPTHLRKLRDSPHCTTAEQPRRAASLL